MMASMAKDMDAVMKAISDLSERAKEAGDIDLMAAANCAWIELYKHQIKSAAVREKERHKRLEAHDVLVARGEAEPL
jgi:hypothetical protein